MFIEATWNGDMGIIDVYKERFFGLIAPIIMKKSEANDTAILSQVSYNLLKDTRKKPLRLNF